jgi:hypothetical protein
LKSVCEQVHSEDEEPDEQVDQHEQEPEEIQPTEEAPLKEEAEEEATPKAEEEAERNEQDVSAEEEAEEEAERNERLLRDEYWEVFADGGWVRDDIITRTTRSTTFWDGVTAGTPTFEYSARGFNYVVNVISMTQLNKMTGKKRSIRRRRFSDKK